MVAFVYCSPDVPGSSDAGPEGGESATSTAQAESDLPVDPTLDLHLGDLETGREYFMGENRGRCLDCHTLQGDGEPTGYALDDVGLRREAEWLAIFLDNPRNLRPEVARMPPFRGDSGGAEIRDVVQFLLTLQTPVDHPEPTDVKPGDEPEADHDGFGGFQAPHGGY